MSTITIPIADEDLAFIRAFSEAQGLSAEAFLAQQARRLREIMQRPLPPELIAASGVIKGDADEETYRAYLKEKYQ